MRIRLLLQESAGIALLTILLQLATTEKVLADNAFAVSNRDSTNYITVGQVTKLEANVQASSKTTLLIRSTQITSSMGVRSLASKGRSKRAGLHDYQALTGNWKQLSQFQIDNSAHRSWAVNFHNEFRKSWIEANQRYARKHYDPLIPNYQPFTR